MRIKDNNNSPHGKFHRFLFPSSSKFIDLNFTSYVLYRFSIMSRVTHSESGLPMKQLDNNDIGRAFAKCCGFGFKTV